KDSVAYRQTCAAMVARFVKFEATDQISWTTWACSLIGDGGVDFGPLVALQEQMPAKRPDSYNVRIALVAAVYRAGRFEDAIRKVDDSCAAHQLGGMGYDWFFLAMAHHRLGHTREARHWLQKATDWSEQILSGKIIDPKLSPFAWHCRLTVELLRHEAETLILGKSGKK